MSHTLNTARVGLFFLLGLALIWVVYQSLGDGTFFREEGYRVSAQFDDLKQLKPGDEVRMAGVRIGSVTETKLVRGRGEAVLTINPHVEIPEDSIASVAMAGLLGNNFISIQVGSSETDMEEGAAIQTRPTLDFNDAFATIGDITSKVETFFEEVSRAVAVITDDDDGLLSNLNEVVRDNRDNLRETLANLREVSTALAEGEGTLGRLIRDDEAYESLLGIGRSVENAAGNAELLVSDLREIVDQIKTGEGPLGALIYDETTGDNLRRIVQNLGEVSDKLAAGEGTLGRLLADETLYHDLQAVLQKAERTIDGLGDQGPITAVGIAANALF
jgi:phospholipid/cholesterol/gamma-HCH transport system substrate-binding protein